LLPDAAWGQATALRFSVLLPLPDYVHWTPDERNRHWWTIQHPRSSSTIRVRTWRAGRLARPEECEAQARLWLPELPGAAPETRLDERRLSSPDGYTTRLLVGVQPGDGERIEGFVLAFGATVQRCLALLFSTDATGPGATAEVGHRLRMVADGVFGRAEIRSVDDRVQQRSLSP